jgi:type II secretory pathway component PulL
MWKHALAALFAAALISAPASPVWAQAAKSEKTETKSDTRAAKKLTPQQQKMKDCGAKWQAYKKEKNVKGQAEYRKFQRSCLKS